MHVWTTNVQAQDGDTFSGERLLNVQDALRTHESNADSIDFCSSAGAVSSVTLKPFAQNSSIRSDLSARNACKAE
jgi:hypothetical protein